MEANTFFENDFNFLKNQEVESKHLRDARNRLYQDKLSFLRVRRITFSLEFEGAI